MVASTEHPNFDMLPLPRESKEQATTRKCCVYFTVAATLVAAIVLIVLGSDHKKKCTPESDESCELYGNILIGSGIVSFIFMFVTLLTQCKCTRE